MVLSSLPSFDMSWISFFSFLKTILVGLNSKPFEKTKNTSNLSAPASDPVSFWRENCSAESKEAVLGARNNVVANGMRSKVNSTPLSLPKKSTHEPRKSFDNSSSNTNILARKSVPSPKTVKGRNNSDEVSEVHHDTSDAFPTEVIKNHSSGSLFFSTTDE